MRMIADRIDAPPADWGYDADAIREKPAVRERRGGDPREGEPPQPRPNDRAKDRRRSRTERFNKLRNWRRIATRYDKTAESHPGFVHLARASLRLPFVHAT